MELSHGHVITKDLADQLGVLDAAEGFVREGLDKPWEAVTPADLPVTKPNATPQQPTGENMAEEARSSAIYDLAAGRLGGEDRKPPKKIKEIRTRKAKSGGYIHEHHHTEPSYHPMEEHTSPDAEAMLAHMQQHMGAPMATNAPMAPSDGDGDEAMATA